MKLSDADKIYFGSSEVAKVLLGSSELWVNTPPIVFTTWNPSDKHAYISLSGGDLIATKISSNGWHGVRSVLGVSAGKFYFEVAIEGVSFFGSFGVGKSGSTWDCGSDANGWSYQSSGNKYRNGSYQAYGSAFTNRDTIACALDLDNGKIWWKKVGGAWPNSGNPETGANPEFTGVSGTLYAQMAVYYSGHKATVNFGASAFAGAVPAGFIGLGS